MRAIYIITLGVHQGGSTLKKVNFPLKKESAQSDHSEPKNDQNVVKYTSYSDNSKIVEIGPGFGIRVVQIYYLNA